MATGNALADFANNPELMMALQRFLEATKARSSPRGLPPGYHGPIDLTYVRPPATEFPRMAYKASDHKPEGFITRVVNSQQENDALPKGWSRTNAETHAILDPLAKRQYVQAEEAEGAEPEEKAATLSAKQAKKDAAKEK